MHARFEPMPDHDSDTRRTAAALRDRCGVWAHISDHTSKGQAANLAYRIRHGKLVDFRPAGAFEATSRKVGKEGESQVWARYVGASSAQDL